MHLLRFRCFSIRTTKLVNSHLRLATLCAICRLVLPLLRFSFALPCLCFALPLLWSALPCLRFALPCLPFKLAHVTVSLLCFGLLAIDLLLLLLCLVSPLRGVDVALLFLRPPLCVSLLCSALLCLYSALPLTLFCF